MSASEWNLYKARRADVLSRYYRMRGNGAMHALFAVYARQYRERAERGEW